MVLKSGLRREKPGSNRLSYFALYLSYLLTPWCRILSEKLIVTQLVKKHAAFSWNQKVHYRVHTSPLPDPISIQLNPVRPIDPYFPKVHLNVILHLGLGLPSGLLHSGFPTETL